LCPRLQAFRADNRARFPDWYNGAVPSLGERDARVLIVGLAPGLRGANRTGRPFTGDYAGDLLYGTLRKFGFAEGVYAGEADDGLTLNECRITNAVRCVPPENRPSTVEVRTCRRFLEREIAAMPRLRAVVALGTVAHGAVLAATGARAQAFPFAHGARHRLTGDLTLADSYHCSRQTTNTGRLTTAMFEAVFASVRALTAAEAGDAPRPAGHHAADR
jgi:uracil-DNA glycosylase family 4